MSVASGGTVKGDVRDDPVQLLLPMMMIVTRMTDDFSHEDDMLAKSLESNDLCGFLVFVLLEDFGPTQALSKRLSPIFRTSKEKKAFITRMTPSNRTASLV